jgi:hypothetical protein
MTDNPLEMLEEIVKIGYKEKDVSVTNDFVLTLIPLSGLVESEIHNRNEKSDGIEYFEGVKKDTLTFSIIKINGKSLRSYEKIDDKEERERVKKETYDKVAEILSKWNDDLRNYVYSEYTKLCDEIKEDLIKLGIIKKEELKEEPKVPEKDEEQKPVEQKE